MSGASKLWWQRTQSSFGKSCLVDVEAEALWSLVLLTFSFDVTDGFTHSFSLFDFVLSERTVLCHTVVDVFPWWKHIIKINKCSHEVVFQTCWSKFISKVLSFLSIFPEFCIFLQQYFRKTMRNQIKYGSCARHPSMKAPSRQCILFFLLDLFEIEWECGCVAVSFAAPRLKHYF